MKILERDVPKGFILGIVTLVVLALGTFFVVVEASDLSTLSSSGSPLPDALQRVYGMA